MFHGELKELAVKWREELEKEGDSEVQLAIEKCATDLEELLAKIEDTEDCCCPCCNA